MPRTLGSALVKIYADDKDAAGKMDDLRAKMEGLALDIQKKRALNIEDKAAKLSLDQVSLRAARLADKLSHSMNVDLHGAARFEAQVSAMDLSVDRLDKKLSGLGAGIEKKGFLKRLAGLIPGVGSGAGGGAAIPVQGVGALGGGASSASGILAQPAVLIPAIVAALASLPFIAQAAAGGIVTALGGGLAAVGIIGAAKTKAVQRNFTDLANTAKGSFASITASFTKPVASIVAAATTALPSILGSMSTALSSIADPLGKVGRTIARTFGDKAVGDSIKAVGKAFGAILTALAPSIPGMIDSIATGITRIANTIKDNPKAFADFIWFLSHVISVALDGIAALTATANYIEKHFGPAMHRVAVIFDGVRHEIAHVWDQIFQNSAGMVIRLAHNIETQFNSLKKSIANVWDTIWRNTVTRVQNGIADVVSWFAKLPGRAVGALTGLGHSLAAFAGKAIGEMWTGFKNVWSTVEHWFTGLPARILHALGIHSPPSWAISAGRHIMDGLNIGLGHGLGKLQNFTTSIGAQVAAGLSGALGGTMGDSGARTHSAAVAQSYAASLLPLYGWSQAQMGPLKMLWNQESGWNAWAVNPSSGAYGIPQSLGHGHPYNLGDYKNQIIWGLNYIKQRKGYGSPSAAWAHEQAYNWYAGGTRSARPGLAVVGEHGPELIAMRGGESVYPVPRTRDYMPSPARARQPRIILEIRAPHGSTEMERAIVDIVRRHVTIMGGDATVALGRV